MTFREKLQEEFPDDIKDDYIGGCNGCPCDYAYESHGSGLCDLCHRNYTLDELKTLCTKCWDREFLETKCRYCGGTLSEIRVHNGRRLQHCYSCHFEFYLD